MGGNSVDYRAGWGVCRTGLLDYLVRHFPEGSAVLDLGCASGGYTRALRERGYRPVGVDIEPNVRPEEMLDVVRCSATGLPFTDSSFDCCVAINVLEHVNDVACLGELARTVRSVVAGTLPASETNSRISEFNLTYHSYVDPSHLRYYTLDSARDLFHNAGYGVIELKYVNPANAIGAALHAMRLPFDFAEKLGQLAHRLPGVRRYFHDIIFAVTTPPALVSG